MNNKYMSNFKKIILVLELIFIIVLFVYFIFNKDFSLTNWIIISILISSLFLLLDSFLDKK